MNTTQVIVTVTDQGATSAEAVRRAVQTALVNAYPGNANFIVKLVSA